MSYRAGAPAFGAGDANKANKVSRRRDYLDTVQLTEEATE